MKCRNMIACDIFERTARRNKVYRDPSDTPPLLLHPRFPPFPTSLYPLRPYPPSPTACGGGMSGKETELRLARQAYSVVVFFSSGTSPSFLGRLSDYTRDINQIYTHPHPTKYKMPSFTQLSQLLHHTIYYSTNFPRITPPFLFLLLQSKPLPCLCPPFGLVDHLAHICTPPSFPPLAVLLPNVLSSLSSLCWPPTILEQTAGGGGRTREVPGSIPAWYEKKKQCASRDLIDWLGGWVAGWVAGFVSTTRNH